MQYSEILRILIPAFIIALCAYVYIKDTSNLYKNIGELEYRARTSGELEARLKTRLNEKDLEIANLNERIKDDILEIAERKEDAKSLRSIINRHEGRLAVYVENEASYLKELAQLRTSTLVAQAKAQAFEIENQSLIRQLAQLEPTDQQTTPA